MNPQYLNSVDGTRIGYEIRGAGPGLVLVHGSTADRSRWGCVVDALAARHTLYLMDRRGRGLSADARGPYQLEREAEDLRALVAVAAREQSAPVYVLGHSYGGLCSLVAAKQPENIERLMVYEPAFAPGGRAAVPPEVLTRLTGLIESGRLDEALTFFFIHLIAVPPATVELMKTQPIWTARLAATRPLAREALVVNEGVPAGLDALKMPVRVLVGGVSPAWLRDAAYAAKAAIAQADIVELPGQAHAAMDTAPELFVDEVLRFGAGG